MERLPHMNLDTILINKFKKMKIWLQYVINKENKEKVYCDYIVVFLRWNLSPCV